MKIGFSNLTDTDDTWGEGEGDRNQVIESFVCICYCVQFSIFGQSSMFSIVAGFNINLLNKDIEVFTFLNLLKS